MVSPQYTSITMTIVVITIIIIIITIRSTSGDCETAALGPRRRTGPGRPRLIEAKRENTSRGSRTAPNSRLIRPPAAAQKNSLGAAVSPSMNDAPRSVARNEYVIILYPRHVSRAIFTFRYNHIIIIKLLIADVFVTPDPAADSQNFVLLTRFACTTPDVLTTMTRDE